MDNRRQFTRVLFSIPATLNVNQHSYSISIYDISLNGALITRPDDADDLVNKSGQLAFSLADGANVTMEVSIAHVEEKCIGLHCESIDIDSISHIRRLVELNLGDDEQLNKEFSQLTTTHEH